MTFSSGSTSNFSGAPGQPGPEMLAARRHPLGLPAGSVRAILALLVFAIIWALLLLPEQPGKEVPIPLYLYYLMFLIIGSYFASRGHAPVPAGVKHWHPLYLPKGSLRLLMIVGFVGAMGWGYYNNPNFFDRLSPSIDDIKKQPYLPVLLLGAFFLGIIVAHVGNILFGDPVMGLPPWFQDILAWVSLLGILGLCAEFAIRLFINPGLEKPLELPHWEGLLSAVVAFYFGARS
jgi:hypothetical protein